MFIRKKKEQQEQEQMLFPGFVPNSANANASASANLEEKARQKIGGQFGFRERSEIKEEEVRELMEEKKGSMKLYEEGRKLLKSKDCEGLLDMIEEMSICYGNYDKGDVLCNKCGLRGLCKK